MAQSPGRKSRKPKEAFELQIDSLNDDGLGVGRHEGKEVLIAGALPGERVMAAVDHAGQRRIIARLQKILQQSPERGSSVCPMARRCLGCSLIHMKPSAQLAFKQELTRKALASRPSLKDVELKPIRPAPRHLGYRTTAKLVLEKTRGQVKVGLYRRGSHDVVDIGGCPLHHPLINKVVEVVREEIRRQDIHVYNPRRRNGLLRYLLVRVSPSRNEAMVTFVTTERNYREVVHLGKWLTRKVPEVISVQQNVNASEGNVVLGRDTLKMLGQRHLLDVVGDVRLSISPSSFFQVNHDQAGHIYDLVRRWAGLSREETALDIYCGIGGIALHLAHDAGRVVGVEVVEEAVRNARANAKLNRIENCSFHAGSAAELLDELAIETPPGSVAVLNPPRKGCEEEVLKTLSELSPRLILYVSCNPESLARDLEILGNHGYRTETMQPFDMFPQTPHVENVACLVPKIPATENG